MLESMTRRRAVSRRRLLIALMASALSSVMLAPGPAFAQQITRVSVSATGGQANGGHTVSPSVSADGRLVAFVSQAHDLVPNDTPSTSDIFVKDGDTGAITRVEVAPGSVDISRDPDTAISADGRFIVFTTATALVPDDTNVCDPNGMHDGLLLMPCPDVYVHDRQTGRTTRVSVATGGAQADRRSRDASISADGRYVLFTSRASNLVSGDANGVDDVFRHDRQTGETIRVGVGSDGLPPGAGAFGGRISENGRIVSFLAYLSEGPIAAMPSCAGLPPLTARVFVRDLATGHTACVPPAFSYPSGTAFHVSMIEARVSADGSTIAVVTEDDADGTARRRRYVHTWNRHTGEVRAFVSPTIRADAGSIALSTDGRLLAICEPATGDLPASLRLFDAANERLQTLPLARTGWLPRPIRPSRSSWNRISRWRSSGR